MCSWGRLFHSAIVRGVKLYLWVRPKWWMTWFVCMCRKKRNGVDKWLTDRTIRVLMALLNRMTVYEVIKVLIFSRGLTLTARAGCRFRLSLREELRLTTDYYSLHAWFGRTLTPSRPTESIIPHIVQTTFLCSL